MSLLGDFWGQEESIKDRDKIIGNLNEHIDKQHIQMDKMQNLNNRMIELLKSAMEEIERLQKEKECNENVRRKARKKVDFKEF